MPFALSIDLHQLVATGDVDAKERSSSSATNDISIEHSLILDYLIPQKANKKTKTL